MLSSSNSVYSASIRNTLRKYPAAYCSGVPVPGRLGLPQSVLGLHGGRGLWQEQTRAELPWQQLKQT